MITYRPASEVLTRCVAALVMASVIIIMIAVGKLDSRRAQTSDFPRTVIDMTGASVTIEAPPTVIGVVSGVPVAEWALPGDAVQVIDPHEVAFSDPAAWQGIDLLIVSEYDTVIYPALIAAAEWAGVPIFR
ncbi:MAG: hypothetical protein JXA10_15135, partial [Anaerolineae bacterium]|nr:hypothetical protein [Anaerolineae bacterium]